MRTIRCLVLGLACACAAFLFSLAPAAAQTLTWSGTSNAWNTTSLNWNGNAATYADNHPVVFNDGASHPNIVVQSAGVQPASVSFATAHGGSYAYTFSGGPIDGSTAVTLSGTGSVTFSASNGYTGGTLIGSGGSLTATSAGALGMGPVTLSGGYLGVSGGVPGLQEGWLNGAFDAGDAFSASIGQSVQLSPRAANWSTNTGGAGWVAATSAGNYTTATTGSFTGTPNFPNNTTCIYTGYMYFGQSAGSTVSFYKNFDDNMLLTVDGSQLINNNAWNQFVTATWTVPSPGWYPIEIRLGQGGGGVGPNIAGYSYGLGYDANGAGGTTNSNYTFLTDPGNGSLLTAYGPGTAIYNNALNVTAASTFNAVGVVSFGNFSLAGPLHVSGSSGNLSFSGSTLLSGSPALNIDAGSSVTLASPASDGGKAQTLTQLGGGSLVLTGTNSFTSGTKFQVNGGSLVAVGQNYASPGPATGPLGAAPITLDNGGLVLASSVAGVTTFDLSAGNVLSLAPSSSDWIVAGSSLAGVSGGTVMLAGATGLTVSGGQTLNLGAVNGCTLAVISALNVTAGTSTLNVIGPVSFTNFSLAGGLHVSGNNGNLPFSGSTLLSGSPVLNIDAGESMMLSSPVSDGGKALTLTQLGAGSLVLTGTNSLRAARGSRSTAAAWWQWDRITPRPVRPLVRWGPRRSRSTTAGWCWPAAWRAPRPSIFPRATC